LPLTHVLLAIAILLVSSDNYGNLTGLYVAFLFAFFFQICDKFEFLNSQGNILKVWWEMIHGFYWKFPSLSSGKGILKFD